MSMLNIIIKTGMCFLIGLIVNQSLVRHVFGETPSGIKDEFSLINNRVTLHANNLSLKDALLLLSQKANIELVLKSELQNKVNISIDDRPIDFLFRRLLAHNNFLLIYSDKNHLIDKVVVYESSSSQPDEPMSVKDPMPREVIEEMEWIHYLSTRPEDEAISGLSEILSTSDKPLKSKQYAIEQLSSLAHNEAVVNAVAGGLADDRPEIREHVINALGQIEHDAAQQILGQIIFGEREPGLRLQAVKQLANIHTPASEVFIKAAAEDKNSTVKAEAEFFLESRL